MTLPTSQQKQLSTLITTVTTITSIMTKTITVSDSTHDALGLIGNKSETYDEIIARLLEGFEK